ncbi:hypothetical protein PII47_07755 [Pseudomonas sp. 21TX0197]|uniref:hypothetical protein n=1 Tax=Pseudomonas sp. 21TX0197 TaxID=2972639 RepID=UPI00232E4F86|nr:hypothetical protein [Pseudomonas sp. 21TX0197]MDB6443271.1 hypothetical protein [Pseudomonas sp. 21TX0197]
MGRDYFKRKKGLVASLRLRWKAFAGVLIATGGIGVAAGSVYGYFVNDVGLEYVRPYGRYYIFELKNDTPVDQVVESFSVRPPGSQSFIFKLTRDIYGDIDNSGEATLPGGNISWIPAVEFHELDGASLPARGIRKFRMPPLSSRDYMQPVAAIFEIQYDVLPANKILSTLDKVLRMIGARNTLTKIRYLVVDNYWYETRSQSLGEAVRIACRDNDSLRSDLCDRKKSE